MTAQASEPFLSWDAEVWVYRWAASGGSIMLNGTDLQIVFRPEDHEILKPLLREFRDEPTATEATTKLMLDRGLDGYSFGLPGSEGGTA